MGMFDEITVHDKWLPEQLKGNNKGWQTKDLECVCAYYGIDEDGQLHKKAWTTEDWKPDPFTGEINFYHDIDDYWFEFHAVFIDGKINKIEQVFDHGMI